MVFIIKICISPLTERQIGCADFESAGGCCSGAAHSEAEAERICEALRAAGIVLKVGDLIYLRPQEVTAMIMRVRINLKWLFWFALSCAWCRILLKCPRLPCPCLQSLQTGLLGCCCRSTWSG